MQIVPDNLNIRTGYHVFETPEDIVINSQLYEKITMDPKPYNFFNTNQCLNNKNLLLYECNILEYANTMISREPDYEYYIQDNQNPDLFYYITEIGASDPNQYICKAQKTETGWKVLNSISPDRGDRWGTAKSYYDSKSTYLHYKLLGQTNDYIILAQYHSGCDSPSNDWQNVTRRQSFGYIAITKSNMTTKSLHVGTYLDLSVFKIKEFDDSIYLYENLHGIIQIIRYDPYTNTRTIFFTKDYNGQSSPGISNIILFRDKYYIFTRNSDSTKYTFQVLSINFEYNQISCVEKILPTISGFPYHRANTRTDTLDCHWEQIDLKNIDDNYIAVTIHDKRNYIHAYAYTARWSDGWNGANMYVKHDQTICSAAGYHRHALYKYDEENDSWIGKGIITPDESNQHIYGVLYYDQYTPIFLLNKRILGYRLNLNTEKYEKCFEVAGTFYTIGIDENNKFYTFDSSNVCHIYNDVTSYLLDAQFEKSSYTYNNADIATYVQIYSKNFVNNYIRTKVKITIEGHCKFTENNKKEIITYTNASGPRNIPVTVTYGGTMYCYIKEVE